MEIRTSISYSDEAKKEILQKLNAGFSIEEIVEQAEIKITL